MKLKIKKLHEDAIIPKHALEGDAGIDLSCLEDFEVEPGKKVVARTGLSFEIPSGYFGSMRDRSSLAAKHGLHIIAGVIDSGYRGEVRIVFINHGKEKIQITKGQRIAQLIIQPHATCDIEEVQKISGSQRGKGGFGSTGTH